MTYIIVFNDGSIKRYIQVDYCDVGYEYNVIILYCNGYKKRYDIKKEDIASVVFYP